MRFLIIALLALLTGNTAYTQTDSCRLRISVLTCSPGAELYSIFGHTAIRVIDSTQGEDVVFNYGTFDFSDPDFYTKFIRGKLDYFLNPEPYREFIRFYQEEQRSITEQELLLSCQEKLALRQALEVNLLGANKYYKYDFLFDNCTTRVRDQLQKHIPGLVMQTPLTAPGTTFRNMIHSYLDNGGQPWSKLGIDILLGSRMDKAVTVNESMFLPDFLLKGIDSARKGAQPLVATKKDLFVASPVSTAQNKWIPLLAFSLLGLAILLLSKWKHKSGKAVMRIIDSILLYVTGLTGCLLVFMWFGTDHSACAANYNLLWALPTNLVAGCYVWKKPSWIKKYFLYAGFLQIGTLLGWLFLPQQLNISLVPVVLLLAYRHFQLAANN